MDVPMMEKALLSQPLIHSKELQNSTNLALNLPEHTLTLSQDKNQAGGKEMEKVVGPSAELQDTHMPHCFTVYKMTWFIV